MAAAFSENTFTKSANTPRAMSAPMRSSGVSPTRKSHQNRPKAASQRRAGEGPRDAAGPAGRALVGPVPWPSTGVGLLRLEPGHGRPQSLHK
jgi:hypothetical protein